MASYGHVRDLPQRKLGIDVSDFHVDYVVPKRAKPVIKELKAAAKESNMVYLATDGDREGEAIAWHLSQLLKLDESKPNRLKFFEVTKPAIENAVAHPSMLDQKLVDAQQARRVLDRLVGYKLSPILWHKVRKGLSAGRVQSVALKMVVDREREIEAFVRENFYLIFGQFKTSTGDNLIAQLAYIDDKKLSKMEIKTEEQAKVLTESFKSQTPSVLSVEKKISHRNPGPPFITSSLQQEASTKLGYSPKKTMVVAQQLYEGVELSGETHGLITYMRTDSFHISEQAVTEMREFIKTTYGPEMVFSEIRNYSKKVKQAQEAHEAIRPTSILRTPESLKALLSREQFKIYELIWRRALATQFAEATVELTHLKIKVGNGIFEAKGEKITEPGYLKLYGDKALKKDEQLLTVDLKEGDALKGEKYESEMKTTEPPARFSAAALIKALEDAGIGRPSTYAPTISTLTDRGYILIEEKKLKPQLIAGIVIDLLSKNFPFVVDAGFTAKMETELDMVATGEREWQPLIKEFYIPFEKDVEEKEASIEKIELPVKKTDEKCPLCGSEMVIRLGRFGEFIACTRFPECKGKMSVHKYIGVTCPLDGAKLLERKTRKGRFFYGCEKFPRCRFASWKKPTSEMCPTCGSILLENNNTEYICKENKHIIPRAAEALTKDE